MRYRRRTKDPLLIIQAWANNTGHQYLGTIEEGDTLKHYVRKANPGETKKETTHPHVANLDELRGKIDGDEIMTILDVREPAEYAFGHIPGAKSIPLGELEQRFDELNRDDDIYVIYRKPLEGSEHFAKAVI